MRRPAGWHGQTVPATSGSLVCRGFGLARMQENDMTPTEDLFRPAFDLGEFRYAVARYVKLLIRARWKADPSFLTQRDLAAWELSDVGKDRQPAWKLMGQAAQALGHLNDQFLPRCGSGGIKETDSATPVGRLIDA